VNDPDNVVDPVVLAERRARRAELAESELRELLRETELGAAALKGRLAAVEGELAGARAQRDALAADLARRETELIAASQREHTELALRSEAQTRAAEATTGSRREVDELRLRVIAAEQRAALLTQIEAEVAERLSRAVAAEKEMVVLRAEVEARQHEVLGLRQELERYAQQALRMPVEPGPADAELAERIAAERSAFAAQIAAIERTVAEMRPQLAAAVTALAERMAYERAEREAAERALETEREKVADLQDRLEAVTRREAAVAEVVAELSASVTALRERFASELETRVAEMAGAADALRAELGREQAQHSAAQSELAREQARHEAAKSELERQGLHREAIRSELAQERAQREQAQTELERERLGLAELAGELAALRATPAPAPPAVDIAEFTRAAERLRAQMEALPEAPEPAAEPEPPAPGPGAPRRREELADILAAQQAAAAAARAPVQAPQVPTFAAPAVTPGEDAAGPWLSEAIRRVGRGDPGLAAEVLLALVPLQAQASRRDVAYQLTIPATGTWRVALRDNEAAIEPGTTAGATDFGISGSPGALAALLAGGGRRRISARVEGSRLRLRRLARDRRTTPTLAQATAAGGRFSLRAVLALTAAVAPEGDRGAVTFDTGAEQITAVGTRGGAVFLRTSPEKSTATLHGAASDLVALLIGLAPEAPIRISGDAAQAAALVARLHRAQGLR
jgi:hypothetical protein